jgi:hypothetical protein
MSVNFYKNRDQMVSAYKEVIDEKSPIDWSLFILLFIYFYE